MMGERTLYPNILLNQLLGNHFIRKAWRGARYERKGQNNSYQKNNVITANNICNMFATRALTHKPY